MQTKLLYVLVLIYIFPENIYSQRRNHLTGIFEGTRIINGHSLETRTEGEMEFLISHRFGKVNAGGYEFFGLDQANIRLGLEYALTHNWTIGVGRSSFEKTYDGFTKFRLFGKATEDQRLPFAATYLASIAYRTLRDNDSLRNAFQHSNLFYTHQLILGGEIGERFSWQLMPTLVHRNYIETHLEKHDIWAIGAAASWDISKTVSLIAEYYYLFPNQLSDDITPSLSIGIDVTTGGHVFQIHFSNSTGMIEQQFITATRGQWQQGDIHIGFNISRIFKLKGRWY